MLWAFGAPIRFVASTMVFPEPPAEGRHGFVHRRAGDREHDDVGPVDGVFGRRERAPVLLSLARIADAERDVVACPPPGVAQRSADVARPDHRDARHGIPR